MHKKFFSFICICLIMTGLLGFSGCGSPSSDFSGVPIESESLSDTKDDYSVNDNVIQESDRFDLINIPEADISKYLVFERQLETEYASEFKVFYYADGYVLLSVVEDDSKFLIIPEGKDVKNGYLYYYVFF